MDERLKGILAEKPRLIVEFPDWMFPPSLKEELRSKELAIAEIAGRDSVAACILAARQRPLESILGTPWPEGKGQMRCVLSGNYLDEEGDPLPWEEGRIRAFFQEFAFPKAEEALRGYLRAVKGFGG